MDDPILGRIRTAAESEKSKEKKQELWRIDKAIDQGQAVPFPDDGKRVPDTIIIPDNQNSV